MSLNWNCKAMTERGLNIWTTKPDVPEDEQELNPVTNALIWATMVVGCDGRNIERFTQRIRQYELACGNLMHAPRPEYRDRAIAANVIRADSLTEDGLITGAELRRHEGFTTNASSLTDAAWAKHLAQLIREKAERSLSRELKVTA